MLQREVLVIGSLVIFLLASYSSDIVRLYSTLVAILSFPAEQNEMANNTVQPIPEKSPTTQLRQIILPETKGMIEIKDKKFAKMRFGSQVLYMESGRV